MSGRITGPEREEALRVARAAWSEKVEGEKESEVGLIPSERRESRNGSGEIG